jgi:hypothetical protein
MNRILKHYRLILVFIIVVIAATLLARRRFDPVTEATLIASIVSIFFAFQNQKREDARLFKELFILFNDRYDKLKDAMNAITDDGGQATPDEQETLYKYFNLCAEEFLFYQRNYIYAEAWTAWRNGMKLFLANPKIRKVWDEEKASDSYYGLTFD